MFINILTHLPLLNIRCRLFHRSGSQIRKETKKVDGVHYWRSHGHEWPFILRALAQAVFDALASAVAMERDFCTADMFIPRKRGGLDPANVEMALYLRGQFDHISKDVLKLSDEEAANAISNRFKDTCKGSASISLNVSDDPKAVLKYQMVCLREFAIRCCFIINTR